MYFDPCSGYSKEKITPRSLQGRLHRNFWISHGHLPGQRGIEVAVNYSIDIRNQKARKFYPDDFDVFDKIFVTDLSNLAKVRKMAFTSDHKNKVAMLPENDEVTDLNYGNKHGFKKVFELIDKACDQLSDELQKPQP